MPQRVAPLREDGQLLQGVPEERELLAGGGDVPEGQRLAGHLRHQRGAAVHPEDRGGLRRQSLRPQGPVQVSSPPPPSPQKPCFIPLLLLTVSTCRFWVGYQYVITNQNHSLEGRWEVAYQGDWI